MTETNAYLSRLKKQNRLFVVDPDAPDSAEFVECHLDQARTHLAAAVRATAHPPSSVALVYQAALSISLAELRRIGFKVAPSTRYVDEDVVLAFAAVANLIPATRSGLVVVLKLYAQCFEAQPSITDEQARNAAKAVESVFRR